MISCNVTHTFTTISASLWHTFRQVTLASNPCRSSFLICFYYWYTYTFLFWIPTHLQLQNQSELRAPTPEKAAWFLDAAIAARHSSQHPSTSEEHRNSHMLFTLHIYQYRMEKTGKGGSKCCFLLQVFVTAIINSAMFAWLEKNDWKIKVNIQ